MLSDLCDHDSIASGYLVYLFDNILWQQFGIAVVVGERVFTLPFLYLFQPVRPFDGLYLFYECIEYRLDVKRQGYRS